MLHNTEDRYLEICKCPCYFMYVLFGVSTACMEDGREEVLTGCSLFDSL